jgi:cyclophilin family peptidyl-prolyl cis-trans isomerase
MKLNKINKKTVFGISLLTIALFAFGILFSQEKIIDPEILKLKAPEKFVVKFETTKGEFEITAERNLSPLAVDRFYQLVKSNYFSGVPFYRCVPNFVAQFGDLDSLVNLAWDKEIIVDEPVMKSNLEGTIAFARAGKNTRSCQLFINIRDNKRLDTLSGETKGFPVFGYVSKGMEVVKKFYTGYQDEPRKKMGSKEKNIPEYLKTNFPKLDYIKKAYILEK